MRQQEKARIIRWWSSFTVLPHSGGTALGGRPGVRQRFDCRQLARGLLDHMPRQLIRVAGPLACSGRHDQ